MSTPRQERGILADILARCANCNIKDHKTQMYRHEGWSGDPDSWLCHVCNDIFTEDEQTSGDEAPGDLADNTNGDQEPPNTPSPRSRRSTRN